MNDTFYIRAKREARGLSQAALAEILHVNQTAVSQWERGVSLPKAGQLPALAKAIGCTIDELYTPEDETA